MSNISKYDSNMLAPNVTDGVAWYDLSLLGVEGLGWTDTNHPLDRLPAHAQGQVTEAVWNLSQHSAGLCVRFKTNAVSLDARWTLRFENLAMDHMPATGCSSVDLYVLDDKQKWRWLGIGRNPTFPLSQASLVSELTPNERQYLLYFPLYNGVSQVEIGLPPEAALCVAPPRKDKPICIYGTSIVQGGCASRPGLAYPSILGRRLNRQVINLGFLGSAKAEPEMTKLLAQLNPAVFIIDSLPNADVNVGVDVNEQRLEHLVRSLLEARPTTPILFIECIVYQKQHLAQEPQTTRNTRNGYWHTARQRLQDNPPKNLHLLHDLSGDNLLGHDTEATVDGVHPNDLGFMRMADVIEPVLRKILG